MKSSVCPQDANSKNKSKSWLFLAPIAVGAIFLAATMTFAWPQAQAPAAAQPAAQGQVPGAGAGPGGAPGRGRGRGITEDPDHPVMKIGTPAPDFTLPGIDGKDHSLNEYTKTKLLAIVFESNHCPVSQLYEGRIKQLYQDYKDKGLTLVAINPNNASAIRLNELGYTDVTDSLPEMKIRAAYRHIEWPYLYDGENQAIAIKFGAVATPHIFIFDQDHKLAYQGQIDDNETPSLAKATPARDAIEALLAGKPVPVATTRAFGCTTKWLSKSGDVQAEWKKIQAEPVKLDMANADALKALRANSTGKIMVVNFWSTKCKDCPAALSDLETTFRMYRLRSYTFTTVSTDNPKNSAAVMAYLQSQYASSPNMQFATTDTKSLQAAFGEKWKTNEPFTVVIGPDGKIIYQKEGKLDILDMRRAVLKNMPDGRAYVGQLAYWNSKP
jgi:peroxiredoxin